MKKKLFILASASLRRSRILCECGIRHRVLLSRVLEVKGDGLDIAKTVKNNARNKASAVAAKVNQGIILGVDTLVLLDRAVIGKPRNKQEAAVFLKKFSGKRIDVFSGLYIIDKYRKKNIAGWDRSSLWVKKIKTAEIPKYLKYLAPFDKAGGFSIEGIGALLFDRIRGSYFNILGLPVAKLAVLMERIGLDLLDFVQKKRNSDYGL